MTQQQIENELVKRSADGKAWVASPLFGEIRFRSFASPSRVPDDYIHSHDPFYTSMIGYKGKIQGFTNSAKIREQNRAVSCE